MKGIGELCRTRLVREIIADCGEEFIQPFTSHDLRRTVATRLAEALGFGGEQLIRRVLGHSDGSVAAIYNRYGYVREIRACLEGWANELLGLSNISTKAPPAIEGAGFTAPPPQSRGPSGSPMQLPLLPPRTRLS